MAINFSRELWDQEQPTLESQTVLSVHNFDSTFVQQVLNKGQQGTLSEACVNAGDVGHPEQVWVFSER